METPSQALDLRESQEAANSYLQEVGNHNGKIYDVLSGVALGTVSRTENCDTLRQVDIAIALALLSHVKRIPVHEIPIDGTGLLEISNKLRDQVRMTQNQRAIDTITLAGALFQEQVERHPNPTLN